MSLLLCLVFINPLPHFIFSQFFHSNAGRGRAKDSVYVVIAQDGKGVAEKEHINKMREKLEQEAIAKILQMSKNGWNNFEEGIRRLQERNSVSLGSLVRRSEIKC